MPELKPFTLKEMDTYVRLTKPEFHPNDWCEPEYLIEEWETLKAFVLFEGNEWAGWCAVNNKQTSFNPGGAHFLSAVTFPGFRGKGYVKYLYKALFDCSLGKRKSACIHDDNFTSIYAAEKYGFKQQGTYKEWNLYYCEANIYPPGLP